MDGPERWIARDTERDLIGSLLVNPGLWYAFDNAGVDSRLFVDERNRVVFSALALQAEDGRAPNLVSTCAALKAHGLLDKAGGPSYVASLLDGAVSLSENGIRSVVDDLRKLERCRTFHYLTRAIESTVADNPSAIDDQLSRLRETLEERSNGSGPRSALISDLELLALPEPEYLINGYLVERSLALLVAPSGIGKSFAALAMALAITTGKKFCGIRPAFSRPVVYVPGEGRLGLKRRILAWKALHGFEPGKNLGLQIWPNALPLLDRDRVREFVRELRAIRPALVIFDTWSRCLDGDENDTEDVARGVESLDSIREAVETAALVIHHTRVDEERERGSSALKAAADTMLQLRAEDDELTLSVTKQKDSEPVSDLRVKLVINPDARSCVFLSEDGSAPPVPGKLSRAQWTALAALRECFPPSQGATKTEWLESVSGKMSRATFYRAHAKLVDHQHVIVTRNRYKIPVSFSNETEV